MRIAMSVKYGDACELWSKLERRMHPETRIIIQAFYDEIVRLEYELMEAKGQDTKRGHRGIPGPPGDIPYDR